MTSFRLSRHLLWLPLIFGASFLVWLLHVYYLPSLDSIGTEPVTFNFAGTEPVKILFWTKLWGNIPELDGYCPLETPCILTTNRSEIESANAIVYHADDIDEEDLPKNISENINVFYSMEALPYLMRTGLNYYFIKFHWIMSYMKNSHVYYPYGVVVSPEIGQQRGFKPIGNFTKEQVMASKKIKGAIWFVSNCLSEERMKVATALKRYFHVDIGGKCSPGKKDLCPHGVNCEKFISQYYFKLAFENANCVNYVTEKYFDTLNLPVVPIVMKRSVYKDVAPAESFIAVDDFASAQKLAEYLNYLIDNPDEYFKYFKWRNTWTLPDLNAEGYRKGFCDLCEKLQRHNGSTIEPIHDIRQWYAEYSECDPAIKKSWYS